MAWHSLPADAAPKDVDAFEKAALAALRRSICREVPPRYRTTYFSHIWDGELRRRLLRLPLGEVLDDDAYYWFKENGGMTRANGQRFRDMILSRGGTRGRRGDVPRVPRPGSRRSSPCSRSAA